MFMFALSGLFLNHRRTIASVDVPHSVLGKAYSYDNWNKMAVKGYFKISVGASIDIEKLFRLQMKKNEIKKIN